MSDPHVPPWLIRCHWCGRNYTRQRFIAPHRYHWWCWLRSLFRNWR